MSNFVQGGAIGLKTAASLQLNMTTRTSTLAAVVRKAVDSDSRGIAQLVNIFAFKKSDGSGQLKPLAIADISSLISKGLFYVAEQEGQVVACGSVVEYDGMAELRSLAVSQQHQGKGLGAALIQMCAQEAKQRGHSTLYTLTQHQNFGLFERAGFKKSDAKPPEKLSQDCETCEIYNSCNETVFKKEL